MPLRIELKPSERFLVNGALFTNGAQRTTLALENEASFLRGKLAMLESEATTPLKCLYLLIQSAYMERTESLRAGMLLEVKVKIAQVSVEELRDDSRALIKELLTEKDFYKALQVLQGAIRIRELLKRSEKCESNPG